MAKRIIAWGLCLVMVFGLCGCKKSKQTDGSGSSSEQGQIQGQTQGPPPVWTEEGRTVQETDPFFEVSEVELKIPLDPDKELKNVDIERDNLSFMGNTIVVSWCHINYEIPDSVMSKLNEYEKKGDWDSFWAIKGEYEKTLSLVFDLNGNLLRSSDIEASYDEIKSDELVMCVFDNGNGETYAIVQRSEGQFLEKVLDDGSLERIKSIDDVHSLVSAFMLPDGRLLCAGWDMITLLDANGKKQKSTSSNGSNGNVILQDGKYYGVFHEYDADISDSISYFRELDVDTMSFSTEKIANPRTYPLINANGGVYYATSNGIVKVDFQDPKNDREIFSWNNTDFDPSHVLHQFLKVVSDNEYYFLEINQNIENDLGSSYTIQVGVVHAVRMDKNPYAGKTLLLIGSNMYSSLDVNDLIRYNTSPDAKCRVIQHNYSEDVVMDGDYMNKNAAMSDKVYLDIVSGTGPDILVGFSQFAQFDTDKVMLDLNPLIDRTDGTGLDRQLLFDNVLRAQEIDGKLYHMPFVFRVDAILGNADLVGQKTNWTYDEFFQAMDALPEGVDPLFEWEYGDLLSFMIERTGELYVDYTSQEVHFDTESFQKLLTFVKKYGSSRNYHERSSDENYITEEDKFSNGMTAWYPIVNLYNVEEYSRYLKLSDSPTVFCGVPNTTGGSISANMDMTIGISAYTPYQEETWDFLCYLLETQEESENLWSTPISRSALDKQNERLMKKYEEQMNIWKPDPNNPNWVPDEVTAQLIDDYVKLVESIHVVERKDPTVMLIILEEAPAYFTGQRSVDEVCKNIQKRAKTVVQER